MPRSYFCYSDLCARNSDSHGAMKIVRMLNVLYTTFDVLTDHKKNPNIYKVRSLHCTTTRRRQCTGILSTETSSSKSTNYTPK